MPIDPPPQDIHDDAETAQALSACGAPQGLADAHGMLCAMLCIDPELPVSAWLDSLGCETVDEAPDPIQLLFMTTHAQLGEMRFDLQLRLPDDDTPLPERVQALGQWCQGFLGGLGLGGIDPARLGDEAGDFLNDLTAIAQVAHDDDSEAAESDLAEITEYLRLGTYLVRDALLARAETGQQP
ncbi:MAG: hypothetical protein DRR03_00480 [Gammaproteobacteria bacterium]|nr:MAG: hypothetical protein DRR03_00480 [Gammaproteobacteria bacterium]